MTLEWFKPDLLNSGDPADWPCWMDSWVHFVTELQSTFGPHDPIADVEHQLEHLRMKDAHCVMRYIVDFNQLASQVQDYKDGAVRLSEGRGQNNQQPTPNGNKKRVVVFLCGSGR